MKFMIKGVVHRQSRRRHDDRHILLCDTLGSGEGGLQPLVFG
jgi:hypothetical protein